MEFVGMELELKTVSQSVEGAHSDACQFENTRIILALLSPMKTKRSRIRAGLANAIGKLFSPSNQNREQG